MSSIFIKGLTKKYDQSIPALSGFNLEVTDGEIVVLAGPHHSGKASVLRLISGYETPTAGDIIINGILVNDIPIQSRNIASVLKHQVLYPEMTVYQNLEFSLRLCYTSVTELNHRIREVTEKMGLTDLLDRKASELDPKESIKVMLLRAVAREPKVLLIDKPFLSRSKSQRMFYRDYLMEINKKLGTTIIIATMDRYLLHTMPYKTVVMKDGYIQQTDLPEELYNHPVNRFVADFISYPGMESCIGTLCREEDRYWVQTEHHKIPLDSQKMVGNKAMHYVGQEVTVGLRSDSIHLAEEEGPDTVDATVTNLEDDVYGPIVTLESGEVSVRIFNESGLEEDQGVTLLFDPEKILLFDKDTEKTIYC